MKYVNSNFTVNIDWNIQRGASRMREDFRRATLFVFLIGHDNVYPVTYTLEDNVIKAVIEPGLPEGVYGLKAVWFKDHHHPCELRHAGQPFRNTVHCGKRSLSQIDNVFGITALAEESESLPENTLHVKLTSAVATYGYDGLSAYEIAIMSGETTLSQSEWVGNIAEANVKLEGIDERFESLETRTGNLFTNVSTKYYETDMPGADGSFWYDSTSLTVIPAGGIVRRVHSAPDVMIIDADTNTAIAELSEANPSFTTEEQIRVYFGGDSSFADNSSGQVSIDLPASNLHDVLSDIYLNLREGEYREININTLQADALEDSVNINGKTYGNESFTITLPNANLDSAGVMSSDDKQALQEHGNRIAQINTTLEEHNERINAKITTDRIEDGAVTAEKIATSAFDSTLSVSGKIAPADVVGEKLTELDINIFGYKFAYDSAILNIDGGIHEDGRIDTDPDLKHSEKIYIPKGCRVKVTHLMVSSVLYGYAVYSASDELLFKSSNTTGSVKTEEFTIDQNGVYVIFSTFTSKLQYFHTECSYDGETMVDGIDKKADKTDLDITNTRLDITNTRLDEISETLLGVHHIYASSDLTLYGSIRDAGNIDTDTDYIRTDKIPIPRGTLITTSYRINSPVRHAIGVYGNDGSVIWLSPVRPNTALFTDSYIVNDEGAYVVFSIPSGELYKEAFHAQIDATGRIEDTEKAICDLKKMYNPWASNALYHHLNVEKNARIEAMSLGDVRFAWSLGFKFIEANINKTRDGVCLVKHGIDGKLGEGLIFKEGSGINKDSLFADLTYEEIKSNVTYKNYRGTIPTIEEFCKECNAYGIGVVLENVSGALDIARKYLTDDRIILYCNNISQSRGDFKGMIFLYSTTSSATDALEKCNHFSYPFTFSWNGYQNASNELRRSVIDTLHANGYLVGAAYLNPSQIIKAFEDGIDMIASSNVSVPIFPSGNELNIHSIGDSRLILSGGASLIDGGILMPKNSELKVLIDNTATSKRCIGVRYDGVLNIAMTQYISDTYTSLQSYASDINKFVSFAIVSSSNTALHIHAVEDTTIYDIHYCLTQL